MDIGPEQPPFIAEPIHDPFRQAPPAPEPAPDTAPAEPVPEKAPA